MTEWHALDQVNRNQMPRPDRPDVTASDVAAFAFCGRSWWLRRQDRVALGIRAHRRAGARIAGGSSLLTFVWICVACAAALGVICAWLLVHAVS